MPRIRTVKPEFWGSASVARMSRDARLLFLGLISLADDEGRLLGAPKAVAGEVFPNDDDVTAADVEPWLAELAELGAIVRYEVEGVRYVAVAKWKDHQRISKPTPSRLPAPADHPADPPNLPAAPAGNSREPDDPQGSDAVDLGPTTVDRGPSLALSEREREIREAVAVECGVNLQVCTSRAHTQLALAARDITPVCASPGDVHARAAVYRARWPNASLTPLALAKHWPSLDALETPCPALDAAVDCTRCDGTGWIIPDAGGPVVRCDHEAAA